MRLDHWEANLMTYLAAAEQREFAYGTWDCCLLAADVVQILRGFDPAAELRGYKSKEDAEVIIKRHGGMAKLADSVINKAGLAEIAKPYAQRGDIVYARLSGGTLGVCAGAQAVFPSTKRGLVYVAMSSPVILKAWRV